MDCPIVWFEALGQHADKLEGFYGEVLGWRFESRRAPRKPALARSALAALRPRGGSRTPAEPPWWVTFYTRVPDLDAAIAKARALGSRVLVPPTQHGDSVIAVVSDPEGHPLGLCT
jgi:predicted enzyme related to lactoylglutathione lyase